VYCEVSAKTGENINDLFKSIAFNTIQILQEKN